MYRLILPSVFLLSLSATAQNQAMDRCKEKLDFFNQQGCQRKNLPGLNSPAVPLAEVEVLEVGEKTSIIPRNPPPMLAGGYTFQFQNCEKIENFKEGFLIFSRRHVKPQVPRTDECTFLVNNPPKFTKQIVRTVTHPSWDSGGKKTNRLATVMENFDYDPENGPHLSITSIEGEKLDCYGGKFDPNNPAVVEYSYCGQNGKRLATKPTKFQIGAAALGRMSLAKALALPPEPWQPKVSDPGVKPEPIKDEQMIKDGKAAP